MIIANPIYDVVFKYLMENLDIAKGVLSTIIGETIDYIEIKAQENTIYNEDKFTFYHLDFIAKIRQGDGTYKVVLIELQKSNNDTDMLRFRRYLGEQYKKEDQICEKNQPAKTTTLPLITIYLLGYYISKTLPAVIKVNREYVDVLEGRQLCERNEFIECLTHDSYVIQIPALEIKMKNRLEYILSIFKQENFIGDERRLKNYPYDEDVTNDDLMKRILKQLEKAAASSKIQNEIFHEEMADLFYDRSIGKRERQLAEKDKIIEQKDKALSNSRKELEEKDKALLNSQKELEEKDRLIRELLAKIGK